MKVLTFAISVLAISVLALSAAAQEAVAPQLSTVSAPQLTAEATPAFSSSLAEAAPVVRSAIVLPAQRPPEHKFFDQQQRFALYVHGSMRAVDTIKTCRVLAHGGREDWIPSQSCGVITAWQAGSVGLALGAGWLFHRTGHHRLERITPWIATAASAGGWTKSVFNIH
jgi:hypothetical protein